MTIARVTLIQSMLAAAILLTSCLKAMAVPAEPGVSHALAVGRAARLSSLRYRLGFTLKEHAATVGGTETLTFTSKTAGDLPLDYRDGMIVSAVVNGRPISTELVNGHLNLPAMAGENTVALTFTSNAAAAGKAITRYEDKDDGSEYVYTLFVPMDASMAFPCFDQPDLKGRFTLQVEHPAGWTVIGNGEAERDGGTHAQFAETRPISTYLFAFAAGPFAAIRAKDATEPTLYVRRSQLARAQQEAPQVQQMTARGSAYFASYFAQPFPFPKYDLVLIPGFPFGGMEHAGATFLNEDGVLFRSLPTAHDYFRRNILVLHETCHQWFGDLVTMRWFDDLWLKEGFAQYMAYRAMETLEPESKPWKYFYEDIKPQAYQIDETQGTTPIFQNIPNLKDAKSAYGAIVYQKAPALLKQLEFKLGADVFRAGLRTYLQQHAYGNAEWSDLIAALRAAGAEHSSAGERHDAADIDAWAESWIRRRGMPEVNVRWSCSAGKIESLELTQQDVLSDGYVWPMANQVALHYGGQAGVPDRVIRVDWDTAAVAVTKAIGLPCPAFVFSNAGDEGYGRFLLDHQSEAAVARQLIEAPLQEQDPLLRSMLWGALWENVHLALSPPRGYVELVLRWLPKETDESQARVQSAHLATALHAYLTDAARGLLVPRAEAVIVERMLHAPTLGLRIVHFRAFISIAETPNALAQLKEMLRGKLVVEGLVLKPLDRWNLIAHVTAMRDPEAAALYAAEKARDHSGEGQKYAYAAAAAEPSAEVKARYFAEYLHSTTVQEDWITQSLGPFHAWNQAALTAPYLTQALNDLPEIKEHRKIFFLGAWLEAFLDGQNTLEQSPAAQAVVRAWLQGQSLDPDLRRKVLEYADALDRTVRIGQRFPD